MKHVNKLFSAHWNTSSLRNEFKFLVEFVKGKVNILIISETKNDERSPLGQFKINGFNTPFRLDRNSSSGGIILFVREDIPAKVVDSEKPPIEGFYVEINLRKQSG